MYKTYRQFAPQGLVPDAKSFGISKVLIILVCSGYFLAKGIPKILIIFLYSWYFLGVLTHTIAWVQPLNKVLKMIMLSSLSPDAPLTMARLELIICYIKRKSLFVTEVTHYFALDGLHKEVRI